jgi:hypothetical protein
MTDDMKLKLKEIFCQWVDSLQENDWVTWTVSTGVDRRTHHDALDVEIKFNGTKTITFFVNGGATDSEVRYYR